MYTHTVAKSCANLAAAKTELWAQLDAMGWVLIDDGYYGGITMRVYKSTGENSDQIPGYIQIADYYSDGFAFHAFYNWDPITHTGTGELLNQAPLITTNDSGFYLWIYGNLNMVVVHTKVGSTWYSGGFGHGTKKFYTKETTLTAGASSGSNVSLEVTSSAGFTIGSTYQIVGATAEGRDMVQVTDIPDSSHIEVASLPRNYLVDARIGQCPTLFGVLSVSSVAYFYTVNPKNATGLNGYNATTVGTHLYQFQSPDFVGDSKLIFEPIIFTTAEGGPGILGYHDENLFAFYNYNVAQMEDTFDVERQDSGTAESGSFTELTDTDKAWTTNAFANKVIIITTGTGAGQIRKIVSNTSDTVTVSTNWVIAPSSDSAYVIANEAYRNFSSNYYSGLVCREGA